MDQAVSSVTRRNVSLRGAAGLFHIPCSTLKDRVDFNKTRNALRKGIISMPDDYPSVFSVKEKKYLAAKIKDLAGRGFGCNPNQIRIEALVFANNGGTKNVCV
jgi:hypothetical protein